MFGSLLTLLSQVMAAGRPRVDNLPRLAVLGRMATVADSIRETETLGQLALRQSHLLGDSVSDDPFLDRLRSVVTGRWQGTAGQLDRHLDPDGDLARRWGKQWPTGKGITARLKRHRKALERQGWILAAEHNGNKEQIWTLVSPAGPSDYPAGDDNGRVHGPGCHCRACPHPVPNVSVTSATAARKRKPFDLPPRIPRTASRKRRRVQPRTPTALSGWGRAGDRTSR